MSIWFHLFKKEVRLGLPAFLLPVAAFIIVVGITAYLGSRAGFTSEAITGVAFAASSALVFYLVYYLFYSLQAERKKLHLWLHSTMPGYALLLAKLAAALLALLVTLLLTGSTIILAMSQTEHLTEYITWSSITKLSLFFSLHIVLIALSFAVWFIFYWMIYLLFTRRLGTFLSFLSTFIFFIIVNTLYSKFSESKIYEVITKWGEMNVSGMLEGVQFNLNHSNPHIVGEAGQLTLYFGIYFFEAIVAVGLFFLAAWLLDRKVEV